jgi:hypothetical protein
LGNFDLGIYLMENGLDPIDKTTNGGALWVIGGRELRSIMEELKQRGVIFTFKRGGGQATNHQDGWWYKPPQR